MNGVIRTLGALAAGAAAMYLMDPDVGRRRRGLIRDKAKHLSRVTERTITRTARDISNRSRGVVHGVTATIRRRTPGDRALAERVRARIGRIVEDAGQIRVGSHHGVVTLRGPVLDRDYRRLLRYARRTAGVSDLRDMLDVRNHLEAHSDGEISGRVRDALRRNWAPAARVLAGTAGGTLGIIGARSRSVFGILGAVLGGALLARSVANRGAIGLVGQNGAPKNGVVRKTVESIMA